MADRTSAKDCELACTAKPSLSMPACAPLAGHTVAANLRCRNGDCTSRTLIPFSTHFSAAEIMSRVVELQPLCTIQVYGDCSAAVHAPVPALLRIRLQHRRPSLESPHQWPEPWARDRGLHDHRCVPLRCEHHAVTCSQKHSRRSRSSVVQNSKTAMLIWV